MINDITAIILTYNEELHIKRCLDRISTYVKDVYIIDCFSTDKTVEIANTYKNVNVIFHEWPGNQAEQFNWALDNIEIKTKWILRLDADEYLTKNLVVELEEKLPKLDEQISAIVLPLGRVFMGRKLCHGIVKDIKMIRLFRYGYVRYEKRLMDEHLALLSGKTVSFESEFIDDNLNTLKYFIDKHNGYSTREAIALLNEEIGLYEDGKDGQFCDDVEKKRKQKNKYLKLPLFGRAVLYFIYRYIFRLGFLDGKEGFLWDFFQGLWYRMLVDAKIYEIKKECGNDRNKILKYIKEKYNLIISISE